MPDASTPPTTPPGPSDTTQAPFGAPRPAEGTGGASQRLRDAARILRERAAAAMGGRPWRAVKSLPFPSVRTQRGTEIASMTYADRLDDARYIATVHPDVAHLVADWLDATSDWTDVLDFATEDILVRQVPGYRRALALADALLTATKETP